MQIQFLINKQYIRRMDTNKIVADSRNYLEAYFMFSSDWDCINKTAVFSSYNGTCYDVIIVDNICKVPHEVIKPPYFTVGVFGGDLITTNTIELNVIESSLPESEEPGPATENVYNQILDLAHTARNIAKESLAIAQSIEDRANAGEFKGDSGTTFIPSVSEDGIISWTNDGGLENPEPVNIKGEKGDIGKPGLTPYIGANGHWWIGDEDTGYEALPEKVDLGEVNSRIDEIKHDLQILEDKALTDDNIDGVVSELVEVQATDLIEKHNKDELAHKELFDATNSWTNISELLI